MSESAYRCGFIAVVGRPNVGKSTLINTILGSKVSIVTPKPQTTRHRILGVDTHSDYQAIYVDTPGIHRKATKAMNRLMNRTAAHALIDADLVLFMTEANRWTPEDQDVLERLESIEAPVVALLNKVDRVHPKEALLGALAEMSARRDFAEVIPISAKRREGIERLCKLVPGFLPESEPLFPEEMITDRGESFRIAEVVREKLTLALRQEIPYGLTVQIERLERDEHGVAINAVIWVEQLVSNSNSSLECQCISSCGSRSRTIGPIAKRTCYSLAMNPREPKQTGSERAGLAASSQTLSGFQPYS
jgi:GTP-binding protein Era